MAPNPSAPTKYAEATLVEVSLKQLVALQVQEKQAIWIRQQLFTRCDNVQDHPNTIK